MIYTLDSVPQEAEDVWYEAMKAYSENVVHLREHEWKGEGFLKPANQDFAAPDIQHVLEHHL